MIQTRSEETGLREHNTLQAAFLTAACDPTIWKISFDLGSERVRLVKRDIVSKEYWIYEPII
jgi:hypothetical protein